MTLFVVAYDLRHSKAYDEIIGALEELDSVHTQESVWYVSRSGSALSLRNQLKTHIHENDFLMVVPFSERPSWTKAKAGTNDWMDRFFPG